MIRIYLPKSLCCRETATYTATYTTTYTVTYTAAYTTTYTGTRTGTRTATHTATQSLVNMKRSLVFNQKERCWALLQKETYFFVMSLQKET